MELLPPLNRIEGMGEIRAKVRLENHDDWVLFKAGHLPQDKVRAREIEAIVDTGAVMTLLPLDLVEGLGLKHIRTVQVCLANDERIRLSQAGSIFLAIGDRVMHTDCLVGPAGCEPLIGQIVMETLDLIPDPYKRTLTPRPESPDMPTLKLKGIIHESVQMAGPLKGVRA